ncbi:S-layer homology domain-containing protein [Paenibacillus ginsengarvi]|uniref:SLH domain-containing protein n=1 Tax=Paenibacillus ginsengarvi TaxID=400777 RepID=A0A3B0C835_9BACL|nr:S-layer homology domain-containing protein [Paenibacillus ginsengarvi]RKN80721.1 hypothetical protein D7M11_19810 [Paenibacillus ginsengarvi]
MSVSQFVYNVSGETITFSQGISKWVTSPDGRYIYAISYDGSRLLFIDTADFSVKKDVQLSSKPLDIRYANGNLYIAIPGDKKISVVDTAYGTSVTGSVYDYKLNSGTSAVDADADHIYYTSGATSELRKINIRTGFDEKVTIAGYEQAQLFTFWYDQTDNVLFVSTNLGLLKLNAATGTVMAQNAELIYTGAPGPVRSGDTIYWGPYALSASDLQLKGKSEDFWTLYADGNYQFTVKSLYNRATGIKITDYDMATNLFVDSNGHIYVYYFDLNVLKKYDSIESLKLADPQGQVPISLSRGSYFYDMDQYWGTIGGYFGLNPAVDERFITHYVIYFMDSEGNKIGQPVVTIPKKEIPGYWIPNGTIVPDKAVQFGIFSKNDIGESKQYAVSYITDNVNDYSIGIENLQIADSNAARGTIDLELSWRENRPNPKYANFEVYYADLSGQLLQKVATVPLNKTQDKQSLSLGHVADNTAKHIAVKFKRKDGTYFEKITYMPIADNVADEPVSTAVGASGAPADLLWPGWLLHQDTDKEAGYLGGRLQWLSPYGSSNGITSFIAYFLNDNDERMQPILETTTSAFKDNTMFGDFLPFLNPHTAIPKGAAKIGVFAKNEHGESETGLIRSIWDSPFAQAAQVRLVDDNPLRGKTEPRLTWVPSGDEKGIEKYQVLFIGESMNVIESAKVYEVDRNDIHAYELKIDVADIPAGAVNLSVMPVNRFGEWPPTDLFHSMTSVYDNTASESLKTLPVNMNLRSPSFVAFNDEDGDVDEIGGVLSWYDYNSDTNIKGYNIYFLDKNGNKLSNVARTGRSGYIFVQIPMNTRMIADMQLGVYAWNGREESATPTIAKLFDRTYSPALKPEQIVAVNKLLEKSATITVNGLIKGDEIKVYGNSTIPYPMASKISEGDSVVIQVPSFEAPAGSVYVTVKREQVMMLESTRVAKPYATVGGGGGDGGPIDPGTGNPGTENPGTGNPGTENPGTENPGTENPGTENPGTENPGTGNPGTGTPGTENPGTGNPGTENPGAGNPGTNNPGTSAPGPIGGGGAPSPSTNETPQPGTYTPVTKSETSNGKTYAVAELDAAKLAEAMKQAGQQGGKAVIDLKDAENAKVVIPANAFTGASAESGVVLSIRSNNVAYELPIGLFDTAAIAKQLGIEAKDVQITVTMEQVTGAAAEQISAQAQKEGMTLLAAPVEFTITVGAGEKSQSMNDFGNTFVSRTFTLTQAVDALRATAVRIDPVTGELHFVPAVFATANGQTEVRMMRQGNSVYAVVETKPKTFADLQGHWAKADIELLASKLIVKGASADAFKPDQSITRAEFASLLVRALGIAEEKTGRTAFTDVPNDAWFAGSVAAAASKGLVTGVEEKRFSPNESITREQMALMISRALAMTGKKASASSDKLMVFADRGTISAWAQAAVAEAVQAGLMNGVDADRFAPAEQASRAQVAVLLKRMLQYAGFMN